ncbi:MAG: hypothetical protein QOF41_711 [Methylobacteriaceae bacterium]|nr:hypothetical protein [Methylobacteriaceae bacterium]
MAAAMKEMQQKDAFFRGDSIQPKGNRLARSRASHFFLAVLLLGTAAAIIWVFLQLAGS